MSAERPSSTTRILVVEDEVIIARDLMYRLEGLGYEVTGNAATGLEALAMAEATLPTLVFMDITIQGPMDGVETAKRLFRTMDVPVVFVTAHTDSGTIQRAKAARPYGYLIKPIEERELITTIEMAVSRHDRDVEARLIEKAMASAGIGILLARASTPEPTITSCNPAFEKMTGYSARDVIGQPPWILEGTATDPAVSDQLRTAIRENQERHLTWLVYRKDGSPLSCTLALSTVRNALGQTTHFLFCLTDASGNGP